MSRRAVPWLVLLVGAGVEAEASACSLAPPQRHVIDKQAARGDRTPPGAASVSDLRVSRGGPNMVWTSCDSAAGVSLQVTARDDRSLPEQVGFLVEIAAGTPP